MATRKRVRNRTTQAEAPVEEKLIDPPVEDDDLDTEDQDTDGQDTHDEGLDPSLVEDPVDDPSTSEGLEQYIRSQENAAQVRGAVVVEVSHPGGTDSVYPGRDGGIRLTQGKQSSRWSDGSKH